MIKANYVGDTWYLYGMSPSRKNLESVKEEVESGSVVMLIPDVKQSSEFLFLSTARFHNFNKKKQEWIQVNKSEFDSKTKKQKGLK